MSTIRKIAKNAVILASGSAGASAIGLISFALIGRILDPELFGVLALAQAYAMIVDRLVNFQSWQALIKFGSVEMESADKGRFRKLLQFGLLLDVGSALLACLIAVSMPWLIGSWLGWTPEKTEVASVFSLIIVFNIEGTPTAILRLYDKFSVFAKKDLITAILKLILVIVGYFLKFDFWYFVLVTMGSLVFGYSYLIIASFKLLKSQKISLFTQIGSVRLREINSMFSGIGSFVLTTNLHSSVRLSTLRLDTIIVDYVLGSASTGLYQVSKQFTKIFTQVSQPLYKSIYPELSRLWQKQQLASFKNTINKFMLLGLGFGLFVWTVFFFFGDFFIAITVGPEYADSFGVTLWYMAGIVISVASFPLTPALLSMGDHKASFSVLVVATVVYFLLIFPLLKHQGLLGAGMSFFVFYLVWLATMLVVYIRRLKRSGARIT